MIIKNLVKAAASWQRAVSVGRCFSSSQNYEQVDLGLLEDLKEKQMKRVDVSEGNFMIVVRNQGQVNAFSGKCCHYGAPLNTGLYDGKSIWCPWHLAKFSAESGEIENTPGLDSLQKFEVVQDQGSGTYKALVPNKQKISQAVPSTKMVKQDKQNPQNYVIIGGGASAQMAAETLRKEGYKGNIVMLSNETVPPYDRILVNKVQNLVLDKVQLRNEKFYEDYGIQLNLRSEVIRINLKSKTVKTANQKIKFDKLLIATGSKAKVMHKRALRYENVFTLRNYADNQKFMQKLKDSQSISIIGGSFIGLETASSIKRWFPDKKVTVFEFQDKPLARVFGNEITQQIVESHINKGIEIITGCLVKNFKGSENQLRELGYYLKADLNTKLKKKTDMCLLATGAELNTKIVPKQLLDEKDNSILVSSKLQTSHPDIFAAGDIAKFDSLLSQRKQRIEHWAVAGDQGIIAARNMLGQQKDYNYVPYFWTFQWFKAEYVGFPGDEHYCETLSNQGDNSARIAYIFKDQKVVGCAVVNVPLAAIKLNIGLENNLFPSKEEIVSGRFKFNDLVEKVSKL